MICWYETRMDHDVNSSTIQLLDKSKGNRRLKLLKPYYLILEFRLRAGATSLEV